LVKFPRQLIESAIVDARLEVTGVRLQSEFFLLYSGFTKPTPNGVIYNGFKRLMGLSSDIHKTPRKIIFQCQSRSH
jgi:hypothetical protein